MRIFILAAAAVIVLVAYPASAGDFRSLQSYWELVTHDKDCAPPTEYSDFFLVMCDPEMTMWYFTKPNHPAHPGVIKRSLVHMPDGAWGVNEVGHSFASDAAQPAFKAWLAQIEDLDRQAREQLRRSTGR